MINFKPYVNKTLIMGAFGVLAAALASQYTPPLVVVSAETNAQLETTGAHPPKRDTILSRFSGQWDKAALDLTEAVRSLTRIPGETEDGPSVLNYNLITLYPEEDAAGGLAADSGGISAGSPADYIRQILEPFLLKIAPGISRKTDHSYGGRMFDYLNRKDAEWTSQIYRWLQTSPEQAALRLGLGAAAVKGRFDPTNPAHREEDPETWLIPSWKDVVIRFYDGDGKQIELHSNTKEILSMANVYTYYTGWEDVSNFQQYADALWNASHSFSVRLGEVYYCEGCVSPEDAVWDEEPQTDKDGVGPARAASENPDGSTGPADEIKDKFNQETEPAEKSTEEPASLGETAAAGGAGLAEEAAQGQAETAAPESAGAQGEGKNREATTAPETARAQEAGKAPETTTAPETARAQDTGKAPETTTVPETARAQDTGSTREIEKIQSFAKIQEAAEISDAYIESAEVRQASVEDTDRVSAAVKDEPAGIFSEMAQNGLRSEEPEIILTVAAEAGEPAPGTFPAIPAGEAEQSKGAGTDQANGSQDGAKESQADSKSSQAETEESQAMTRENQAGSGQTEIMESQAAEKDTQAEGKESQAGTKDTQSAAKESQSDPGNNQTGNQTGEPEHGAAAQPPEDSKSVVLQLNQEGKFCPGHVDMTITARITGLSERNNLFGLDRRWAGWTPYTKKYVRQMMEDDWKEKYGQDTMELAIGTPLTQSEIRTYLALMPPETSAQRRAVVTFALRSVGKIPYYFGGKAHAAGYESNSFSSPTRPDTKGRILSGLDCSGWVNWVYWTVTGSPPTAFGTSGLSRAGKGIAKSDLRPGDILVKPGLNSHVVMFIGWAPDGSMVCVHETGGVTNNVTVSSLQGDWPYYRSLLD